MSAQDWIKYLAQEFVQFIDTPSSERKRLKEERKKNKEHWQQEWFGSIPLALRMLFKKKAR